MMPPCWRFMTMEEPASQRDTVSPLTDPARWDSDSRAHESSRQLSSTVPERRNAGFMRTAIWEWNMVKTAGEGALPLTVDHGGAQSTIYLQLHTQLDLADAVCAIFVSGLPYCEASLGTWLSELLSPFGKSSAIVVFSQPSAWKKALRSSQEGQLLTLSLPDPEGPPGLKGWVESHKAQFPGVSPLKQQLDAWLSQHEADEARSSAAAAAQAADDGWTVVRHRGGRRKTTDAGGTAVGALAAAAAATKHSNVKDKSVQDFYGFQKREGRRQELMDLQKSFASDQRRIAELRQARRFKPY